MEVNYEQWHNEFKMRLMQTPLVELERDIRQMEQQLKRGNQLADLSSLYYAEVNMYFTHSSAYKALKKVIEYQPYFEKYASRLEMLRIRLGTYSILEIAGYDETYFEGTYAILKEIRKLDAPMLEASALNNLGTHLLKNRRFEESIGYFLEAARIYEQHKEQFFGPLAFYIALNIISNSYALNDKPQAEKWLHMAKAQGEHDPFIAIFLKVIDMTWELDHGDANRALQLARELLEVDTSHYDNRIMMMLDGMVDVFRYHEAIDEEIMVLEQLIAMTNAASSAKIKQELVECQYSINEVVAYEGLYEDGLTGVWNRQGFEKTVMPLTDVQSDKYKMLAIVDVDYFKEINDTHGHAIGDAALQEICARVERVISSYIAEATTLYFGRYGGDEFLLYYEATEPHELERFIRQLHEAVTTEPFTQRKTTFPLSLSIGAVATTEATSYETFLKLADDALYHMKKTTKGQFIVKWLTS